MTYRIVIAIKNAWWIVDGHDCRTFNDARKHQRAVEREWFKTDTAILAADGRVLNFHDIDNTKETRQWHG